MRLNKLGMGVAIAALLVTTPAGACYDWKAIAMMDAALISHGDKMLEIMKGTPGLTDVGAINAFNHDVDETRSHINSALADPCGSRTN